MEHETGARMIMTPEQLRAFINEQAMLRDHPPFQPGALAAHIISEIESSSTLSVEALGLLIAAAAILTRAHHEAESSQAAAAVLARL